MTTDQPLKDQQVDPYDCQVGQMFHSDGRPISTTTGRPQPWRPEDTNEPEARSRLRRRQEREQAETQFMELEMARRKRAEFNDDVAYFYERYRSGHPRNSIADHVGEVVQITAARSLLCSICEIPLTDFGDGAGGICLAHEATNEDPTDDDKPKGG